MPRARIVLAAGVVLAVAAGLSACAPVSEADAGIRIVASTNVYGDLAETIGGEFVSVTSVIDDPAKDPHEYEADARTQLALSKADLVVRNGGGYDDFIDTMLAASGNDDVTMIDAVEVSAFDVDEANFNEHVWYDYQTVAQVVTALESRMSALDPAHAAEFARNGSQLKKELAFLQDDVAEVAAAHAGAPVAITEPVPLYLLEAMGLVNHTPGAFSEAVEDDTDAPPAVLRDTIRLFTAGEVELLVYNPQTSGPQTEAVLGAADDAGVPSVAAGELIPEGEGYLTWQRGLIAELAAGLGD